MSNESDAPAPPWENPFIYVCYGEVADFAGEENFRPCSDCVWWGYYEDAWEDYRKMYDKEYKWWTNVRH